MGHVQRIAVALDRPIVELLEEAQRERLYDVAFVHARGAPVPVWWTSYPLQTGLLIGWAGGPAASELGRRPDRLCEVAVSALARSFGIDRRRIARHLIGTFSHDWARDPFARGAYSYPAVGGSDAARRLARPAGGTLFFAGEATDVEGRNATVHGAIASGERAAAQVEHRLARR
jgi:monoamine oxidase